MRFLITLMKRNRKILNKKNCAARRRNNRKRRLVGKMLEIEEEPKSVHAIYLFTGLIVNQKNK